MQINARVKNWFDMKRHLRLENNCKSTIAKIRWEIAWLLWELHPRYNNDKIYFIVKKYIRDDNEHISYDNTWWELTVIIDWKETNFSWLLQARFVN